MILVRYWVIEAIVFYRSAGKVQVALTGFEPMTSAMPVQCWCNAGAMLVQCWCNALPTELRSHSVWEQVNLLGSFVPGKDSMNEMNVYLKCGL